MRIMREEEGLRGRVESRKYQVWLTNIETVEVKQ
jgi:hypothetical protein